MFRKLLLAGVLAAAMAYAQRGGGMGGDDTGGGMGGRGGGMGGMMGGMPRAQHKTKPQQIADKLKLNKEQKEQFQAILTAAAEKAVPIRGQMDKQRAEIAAAMIDGKTSDDVQKEIATYSALAAQLTSVETEAFGKLYATLKPNQQAKSGEAFELMAGLFSGPGGRGGTGRAGREGR